MRKRDVVVGETYIIKVSERLVPVRLTEAHPLGGWLGVSLVTGRQIRVKSAGRLRAKAEVVQ